MKKYLPLMLLFGFGSLCFGQSMQSPKNIISTEKIEAGMRQYYPQHIVKNESNAPNVGVTSAPRTTGTSKTTTITAIGSASNVFSIVTSEQNQVFASDDLNSVGFIHRSNTGIFGGNSGDLRYDLSTDGGNTFCTGIGPLNPLLNTPARYPNAAFYNPTGNNNPLMATIVGYAPTVASNWIGEVDYAAGIDCQTATVLDEQYVLSYPDVFNGGGFCEGLHGEYWSTILDRQAPDSAVIRVFKRTAGTYPMTIQQAGNIEFALSGTTAQVVNPNIAFSPDGAVGYIACLTDLPGDQDSAFYPVFMKTTDNGANWSAPVSVDLNAFPWIKDSLQSLWETSPGVPASSGIAGTAFDFDLTVDANGNPHMVVVVGSFIPGSPYSFPGGLEKFLADVYSNDGGQTWNVAYISPILTFRTPLFGSSTTIYMDNNPQISRSEDGEFIFYSWADSDTAVVTGNQSGIGFGESDNLSPNLRIAGMRLSTGERSYPQLVTDGNLLWDGRILFPTMAPTVLSLGQDCFSLPIVTADMPTQDPLNETFFYYFGTEAQICASIFCDTSSMDLGWTTFGYTGAMPPCLVGIEEGLALPISLGDAFPNPNNGRVAFDIELPFASHVLLELTNAYGQKVMTIANGEFATGSHRIELNTEALASGIYFYSLRTENEVISKRMVIAK